MHIILMSNFLVATFIHGATSIPDSRVVFLKEKAEKKREKKNHKLGIWNCMLDSKPLISKNLFENLKIPTQALLR